MRNRAFAVMAIVAFFVGIELNLYFIWTQSYLNQGGGPFDARSIAARIAPANADEATVKGLVPTAETMVKQGDKTPTTNSADPSWARLRRRFRRPRASLNLWISSSARKAARRWIRSGLRPY